MSVQSLPNLFNLKRTNLGSIFPQVPLHSSRTSHLFLSQVLANALIPPLLPILLISVFWTALPNWHLAVKFQVSPSRSMYDYSHQGTQVMQYPDWDWRTIVSSCLFFWDLMINRIASGIGVRESPLLAYVITQPSAEVSCFIGKGECGNGHFLCVCICVTPQLTGAYTCRI